MPDHHHPESRKFHRLNIRKRLLLILAFLALASCAFAACTGSSPTWTSTLDTSSISTCITNAATGDVINVASGSASISVTVPNTKGLSIIGGNGGTSTVTNGTAIVVNSNATTGTRVSGFTFTNAGGNGTSDVQFNGSTSSAMYRLDHCNFTNAALSIFVELSGNGPGLIDHNSFTGAGASEEIHNLAMGPSSNAGWQDNITPGSPLMVYLEDNTFSTPDPTYICSGIESYYGSRNVLRHNTLSFCQIDQHGTAGSIGARWWEIYNNTISVPAGRSQCCDIVVRDGSGVIYNNHQSLGSGSSGGDIELYAETSGTWPVSWQIGAGLNDYTTGYTPCAAASGGAGTGLNTAPAQVWGNDSALTVNTNGNPNGTVYINEDFLVSGSQPASMHWIEKSGDTCSTTYTYSPFTYPYPLNANGLPNPNGSAPSGAVIGGLISSGWLIH